MAPQDPFSVPSLRWHLRFCHHHQFVTSASKQGVVILKRERVRDNIFGVTPTTSFPLHAPEDAVPLLTPALPWLQHPPGRFWGLSPCPHPWSPTVPLLLRLHLAPVSVVASRCDRQEFQSHPHLFFLFLFLLLLLLLCEVMLLLLLGTHQ